MKHELMTIGGLEITYGDMREEDYEDVIPYRVTREGDALGTDFVEGKLPACTPLKSYGFSEEELWDVESIMRDNMQIVYDQTRKVGAWAEEPEKEAMLANDPEETMSYITTKEKLEIANEAAAKAQEAAEVKEGTARDYEAIAKSFEAAAKAYKDVAEDYEAAAKQQESLAQGYKAVAKKYGDIAEGYKETAEARARTIEIVEIAKKATAKCRAERELAKALNATGRGAEYFDALDDPNLMDGLLDEFGLAPKKA